jgi:basic membrane protein A
MIRSTKPTFALTGACAALTILLAGCGLFPGEPSPTPARTGGATPATTISTETATPTPAQRFVNSVTLVAQIGEPKDWTRAGLTWKGVETAAAQVGATTKLVEPVSNVELPADVEKAAGQDRTVVVTVGPDADAAVRAAAKAHPATQFLELGVVVPDTSPSNVHGLVFDQAEAGYLAGYIAAALTTSGKVGMVGDTKTDVRSTNFAAGFKAGAAQANAGVAVAFAYAGTPDSPDKGRTAGAALVKAGNTVLTAAPSLSGIGALREACGRKAQLVAVDTDAWQTVSDIRPCLVVSVMNRYDAAAAEAIATLAAGAALSRVSVSDVAGGAIGLSDFHADLPVGFQDKLDAVVGALTNGPARSTPAPASASPKP